jgi:hypothetical protein
MTTTLATSFDLQQSTTQPTLILPQKLGTKLWVPMFAMSLMGFIVGFGVHLAKAAAVSDGAAAAEIAQLAHYGTAAMFVGFVSVFSGVTFAIARILGVFRVGGGAMQLATKHKAFSLNMPPTGKAFIGLMAMGMMLIVGGIIGHLVVAGQVGGSMTVEAAELLAIKLEAARRLGVSFYLLSIGLGLATITEVLRFQSLRIRELAS